MHVEVPARHQGITCGSNLRSAVVLRPVVPDLRSLRMIDMDRPGALFSRIRIAWRRNAHDVQDTSAPPHPPGSWPDVVLLSVGYLEPCGRLPIVSLVGACRRASRARHAVGVLGWQHALTFIRLVRIRLAAGCVRGRGGRLLGLPWLLFRRVQGRLCWPRTPTSRPRRWPTTG